MKIFAIMLKDLRLIGRDRFALASLLVVPMVVILVVASATQSGDGSESILFPIVNEDQGPVAAALIKVFRKHLDVREVTRKNAERLVADENDAPAASKSRPIFEPPRVRATTARGNRNVVQYVSRRILKFCFRSSSRISGFLNRRAVITASSCAL